VTYNSATTHTQNALLLLLQNGYSNASVYYVKGPILSKLNCAVSLLRNCTKNWIECVWVSLSEMRISVCERHRKGQFWGLRYCLSKLRSLLSFPVRCNVTQ